MHRIGSFLEKSPPDARSTDRTGLWFDKNNFAVLLPTQVGWIYCFNNDANIRGELEKWRQQDWVQVLRLTGEVIDPRQLKR